MPPLRAIWKLRKETFKRAKKDPNDSRFDRVMEFFTVGYFFLCAPVISVLPAIGFFATNTPFSNMVGLVIFSIGTLAIWLLYLPLMVKEMQDPYGHYSYKLKALSAMYRLNPLLRVFDVELRFVKERSMQERLVMYKKGTGVLASGYSVSKDVVNKGTLRIQPVIARPKAAEVKGMFIDYIGLISRGTSTLDKSFVIASINPFMRLRFFLLKRVIIFWFYKLVYKAKTSDDLLDAWIRVKEPKDVYEAVKHNIDVDKLSVLLKLDVPRSDYESMKDLPTTWVERAYKKKEEEDIVFYAN